MEAANLTREDLAEALRNALRARVAFLATANEVFTEALTEERMKALDFDQLARARRYVGTNPTAGIGLLDDLRRRWAVN